MAAVMRLCFRLAVAAVSYVGFVDDDGATAFIDDDGATSFIDDDGVVG